MLGVGLYIILGVCMVFVDVRLVGVIILVVFVVEVVNELFRNSFFDGL